MVPSYLPFMQRERKVLSVKRLDLDARKASNRKAQGNKVATVSII